MNDVNKIVNYIVNLDQVDLITLRLESRNDLEEILKMLELRSVKVQVKKIIEKTTLICNLRVIIQIRR